MKNHSRLYSLLAAGTLTALIFLTFLLFRDNQLGAVADAAANALPGTTATPVVTVSTVNPPLVSALVLSDTASTGQDQALTTLQVQNAKLVQMLQVMQERERQYQSQLNAANQALQTTQAQSATPRERHEHGEDEHEEHAESEGFGE